jgi:biotin carboxylase
MTRVLVLIHRGSPTTVRVVQALRESGMEPIVFSSAPSDGGARFRAMCEQLKITGVASESVTPTAEQVFAELAGLAETCVCCFAIWEGQRPIMAEINRRLGAVDVAPEVIRRAQDKHGVRSLLRGAGMSDIQSFRLADPELKVRIDRGERHVVKPRRGVGSLLARAVTTWADVETAMAELRRGVTRGDLYEEFFLENELVAETFFEGREVSLEIVRQAGRTMLACDHEKTSIVYTPSTVLEMGLASPAVDIAEADIRAGIELAGRVLDVLALTDGCYHVELRIDETHRWEIIEVNTRIGGGFIFDSVLHQFGRSMLNDWIDLMTGKRLPATAPSDRTCGSYCQVAYAEAGRRVAHVRKDARFPEPRLFLQLITPGHAALGDREDISTIAYWVTPLADHRRRVKVMRETEYVTFDYDETSTDA